jgi:hypothetical protein
MVRESTLPYGQPGGETVREAALDKLHGSLQSDIGWRDEKVEMIGHDDVFVEQVTRAIVIDYLEEKIGVALDLKESTAIVGGGCNEVSSRTGGAARDRHLAIVSVPQRLKPRIPSDCCGTAEAVPLSST